MRLSIPLFVIGIGFASALAPVARATTVVPFTLDELSVRAPVVVYGQIVQIEVDAKTGFRTAVLEAKEIAKSPREFEGTRDFHIALMNRRVPAAAGTIQPTDAKIVERVSSAPEFRLREEVVVFLKPATEREVGRRRRADGRPVFNLMGFHQGKWRIFEDSNGVRRAAAWNESRAVEVSDPELLAQQSTARTGGAGASADPTDATVPVRELRTLDAVLNNARARAGVGQ